jgi:hypothetical protein
MFGYFLPRGIRAIGQSVRFAVLRSADLKALPVKLECAARSNFFVLM